MIDLTEEKIGQLLQEFYMNFFSWMRYQYKQMGQDKCLTLSQFHVLFKINEFGVCNMSCLSEAIEVSKGTMTSMLNKLVEEGYVKRSSSSKDRRNVYVSLTQKGEEKLNYIKQKFMKAVINTLSKLDDKNREEIQNGLECLTSAFKGKK